MTLERTPETGREEHPQGQGSKFLIDIGPLAAFFITYAIAGIYAATGVLMAATVASLLASWKLLGRLSMMPIITAVIVCIFGGLTFWLNDPSFIKMKPTMVNVLFAAILAAGLFMNKPLLKVLFGEAFALTDEGWRKLTLRWILFFLAVAALNEVVWRNFSEAAWVNFKVFGILPLTMLFAIAQIGLIKRHALLAK